MAGWHRYRYKTDTAGPVLRWYLETMQAQGFARDISITPVRTKFEVSYEYRYGPSPIIGLIECGYLPPVPDYPLDARQDTPD